MQILEELKTRYAAFHYAREVDNILLYLIPCMFHQEDCGRDKKELAKS